MVARRRIITRPNYLISLVVTLFRRARSPTSPEGKEGRRRVSRQGREGGRDGGGRVEGRRTSGEKRRDPHSGGSFWHRASR